MDSNYQDALEVIRLSQCIFTNERERQAIIEWAIKQARKIVEDKSDS